MSLDLDERQRAMLQEMGVRVWAPLPVLPELEAAPEKIAAYADPIRMKAAISSATPIVQSVTPTAHPVPSAVAFERAEVEALDWSSLEPAVAACQACGLCRGRKNTVFGVGDRQARWLVVGEAPGENEDATGQPFVGNAGQLLDNMLKAIGLDRTAQGAQGVFITNVLKCRPPANRNPGTEEILQCEPYLRRQVALLQPRIILALGRFAAQSLLQATVPDVASIPLGKLRGQVHQYQGVPVIVSYHPAYLLRSPGDKAKAWADLCLAMQLMKTTAT